MIQTHPSYLYAQKVVKKQVNAPKYVIKQARAFIKIADGKDKKYCINQSTVNLIDGLLRLFIMPTGSKVGQPMYDATIGYQWLFYIAVLCTVWKSDSTRRRYQTAILEICRKNFKALSLDTPIPTPGGWSTMGKIKPGDYVFSVGGNPTMVIGESEIFDKPMYLVEFEDGEKIKASSDHVWTVKTKSGKKTSSTNCIHNKTGKKYSAGGWFAVTTADMADDFARRRRDGKGTEYKYRVPMSGAMQYPEKNLPIDPYLLGMWLGDGSSSGTLITVGDHDKDETMLNLKDCGYKLEYVRPKDRAGYIKVDRNATHPAKTPDSLLEKLRSLDLIRNKHIPAIYLQASIPQRLELLKGLMDSDGSCSLSGQCSFIQKSKVLSEQVLELINSLGIKAGITERSAILNGADVGNVYFISFYVDKAHTCFKLSRKTSRLKDTLNSRMESKSITNIVSIPAEKSKCIMVADNSHLYLAGKHFTATHNTFSIAVIFLLLFFTEPQFSKFFSVAPDGTLSKEVQSAIKEIIAASPALRGDPENGISSKFKVLRDYTLCIPTQNKFTPLACSTNRLDGRQPSVFLADEVGALPTSYPIQAMRSGQILLKNKLGCIISTKYPTIDNPFEDEVEIAKKVLDGELEDETVFALLYEPDNTKDWATNDGILEQANPAALEIPEIMDELKHKRETAKVLASARENFVTKHCNIIYQGAGTETFIDIKYVRACEVDKVDFRGMTVYVGVDLSLTNDNTAVAIAGYDRESGKVLIYAMGFIPAGRVSEKQATERVDYYEDIQTGIVTPCGDLTIDYSVVEQFVMDIQDNFGCVIGGIAFDRFNCLSSAQKWENSGFETVEVKQHSSVLHPATKRLCELITSGRAQIERNELLEINFQNARCRYDTNMNRYVDKKRSVGKVDEVVAIINAMYLIEQNEILDQDSDWGAMY